MLESLPVLIVGYARAENTLMLIKKCIDENVPRIYVSLDGARTREIESLQNELVQGIHEIQASTSTRIDIWRRVVNLGPGAAVITAIDWIFENEVEAIILEDDLEVDGDFFRYMNMHIGILNSSSTFLVLAGTQLNPEHRYEISLTNIPVIWGWATTKSKWSICRNLILNQSLDLTRIRNLRRRLFWYVGRKKVLDGIVDTWDIPLAAGMYAEGYECLLPPVNLVTNNGFDSMASHTSKNIWPLGEPRKNLESHPPLLNQSRLSTENNNVFMENKIINLKFYMVARNIFTIMILKLMKKKTGQCKPLIYTVTENGRIR